MVSLSSGYHPQSNGQTEQANQDLETVLHCVAARYPASWLIQLSWIENTHNSLVCSATGMSTFMVSNGFQPPLFPVRKLEVAVPIPPSPHSIQPQLSPVIMFFGHQ